MIGGQAQGFAASTAYSGGGRARSSALQERESLAQDLHRLIPPVQELILNDSTLAIRVEQIFQNAMLNLPDKITRILEEYGKR